MRIFEKAKIEPLSAHQSSSENSIHQSSGEISTPPAVPQAKDTYGTRRPRVTEHHTTRQTRQKPEEPQCVTLSSDEEEETPEIKKFKNEPTANEADTSNISQDSSAMHSIEPMSSESETSNKYITTTENQPDCADLEKWSTAGWGGPYFLVNCRSARIGSYRFIPRGRVLFCSKGIRFEVPVVDESGRPSGSETVHITIETFQLLQLEVHFSRSMPVIFLYVTPSLSRSISLLLGLTKDGPGPYFDALSTKEFEKRLTLLPSDLDDAAKNAIRQAFVPKGVFREIDSNEAHRLLVLSSPPEVIEGMKSHDQSPTNTPAHPKSPTVTPSPKVSGDEAVSFLLFSKISLKSSSVIRS